MFSCWFVLSDELSAHFYKVEIALYCRKIQLGIGQRDLTLYWLYWTERSSLVLDKEIQLGIGQRDLAWYWTKRSNFVLDREIQLGIGQRDLAWYWTERSSLVLDREIQLGTGQRDLTNSPFIFSISKGRNTQTNVVESGGC